MTMKSTLLLVWAVICSPFSLFGAPTSAISGTIVDHRGHSLSGAIITLKSVHLDETHMVVSGESGVFLFPSLSPGRYVLTASSIGMQPVVWRVELGANQNTGSHIRLFPIEETSEKMTVAGPRSEQATTPLFEPEVGVFSHSTEIMVPKGSRWSLPLGSITGTSRLPAGISQEDWGGNWFAGEDFTIETLPTEHLWHYRNP